MHKLQVETENAEIRNIIVYLLTVNDKDIKVKSLSNDQHMDMSPVVQIINPPLQPRYELSLRERLGNWKIEKRKHKMIRKIRITMNKTRHIEECYRVCRSFGELILHVLDFTDNFLYIIRISIKEVYRVFRRKLLNL
ncbi:hypothetical protein ACJIZ3_003674 [Penstemon smallii]|uniref:Uncharacterized protein n=1 Tax=Penstemon smallii TaxID=265156 RepID=A0ABD3UBW8_9LAMI